MRAYYREAPDQARAFLVTHLPHVPASEQPLLLHELAQHLGLVDEGLLTPYVQSPSPDVRRTAVPLLARLPGNWLVKQLWAYAHPFFTLQASSTGEFELLVTLPAHWQDAWQESGIEQVIYGLEETPLGWVEQMLALIPPQHWTTHWQLTPEQWLDLASRTGIGPTLFKAWAAATSLHGHPAWAIALVAAELGEFYLPGSVDYERVYSPVRVLPAPAVVALLSYVPAGACLRDKPARWQRVLLAVARPWPEAILKRVLQLLADSLQERSHQSFRIVRRLLIQELVRATAPAHEELVAQRLAEWSHWQTEHNPLIEAALQQVQFRRQLTQWLAKLSPVE